MAQVPKRTPRATNEAIKKVGRKANPKHTELYAKQMTLTLAGADPDKLQAVAAHIMKSAGEHEYVKGGKTKSPVTVTKDGVKRKPLKIFDGILSPDSV